MNLLKKLLYKIRDWIFGYLFVLSINICILIFAILVLGLIYFIFGSVLQLLR